MGLETVPDRPPDPHLDLHLRLLEGDPTAPSDVAKALLAPVLSRLRHRHPNLARDTDLHDSVVDAVLSYVERPVQFDPSKMSLLAYLTMSANGDVLNSLKRSRRRWTQEISLELVEESPSARKPMHDHIASADEVAIGRFESRQLMARLRKAAQSDADLRVLQLMVDGERRTELFALALHAEHLAPVDQKRVVKQAKDRLKKRLQRLEVGTHA